MTTTVKPSDPYKASETQLQAWVAEAERTLRGVRAAYHRLAAAEEDWRDVFRNESDVPYCDNAADELQEAASALHSKAVSLREFATYLDDDGAHLVRVHQ